METNDNAEPPRVNSLEFSLKQVLNFYDIQVDLPGILKAIPVQDHEPLIEDFGAHVNMIAERLDLRAAKVEADLNTIYQSQYPALIVVQDKVWVFLPDALEGGRFMIPYTDHEVNFQMIEENYSGEYFTLIPKDEDRKLDLSHMYKSYVLDWFWQPITSFWGRYAEVLLCTFFINILALAVPLYTMNVYDRVVINFVEETLFVLTSGVILALVFDFIFKTLRSYILEKVSVDISNKFDVQLMERMMKIRDVDLHLTTGEKANLFRELQSIKDLYASRLAPTVVDIPFFLLFTFVIYKIAPSLALIPLIVSVIIFALNYSSHKIISRYTAKHFSTSQKKSAVLIEMLNGLSTIRNLGADGAKLFRWQRASKNSSEATSSSVFISGTVSNFTMLLTQIAQVCIIFFGAYLIYDGSLTVGGLIACSIIYGRSITPIVNAAGILSRLKETNDVLKVIDRIFQMPHQDSTAKDSKGEKGPFKGKIEIKNIIYQYPKQAHPSLYRVNSVINPGEHIGILGKTGAGKTTLTQMIAGLIAPNEGDIYLDNYSYNAIAQTELRRRVGYVPQDGFYFAGSLKDNITMSDPTISEEDLERALYMSGLDLVMEQTSEGLDMDVGEGGKRLSGGQRQAIALARVFSRNPDIILFDEPTNGMDHTLENRVKQSLGKFIEGKTFIMVTHRTTLLPLVSRLIVLDQGRVIADGERDDIIKRLS